MATYVTGKEYIVETQKLRRVRFTLDNRKSEIYPDWRNVKIAPGIEIVLIDGSSDVRIFRFDGTTPHEVEPKNRRSELKVKGYGRLTISHQRL